MRGLRVVYGAVTVALAAGALARQREDGVCPSAVQEGARRTSTASTRRSALVGVVLFVALIFLQDIYVAIGFAIGGLSSAAAGYIGMNVSVRSNARVAEAARGGVGPALDVAFRGGAVTGMLVVGLALIGVAGYYGDPHLVFDATPRRRSTR